MNYGHYVTGCAAVALLMLHVSPSSASRAGSVEDERAIAHCIHRAAFGRPWLEKTLWGLRDQEGGWIGAAIRNRNGSYDLGPFQINSWWVPRIAARIRYPDAAVTYWLRMDPCFNAEAARWIILTVLRSSTSYWQAVGRYHSPERLRGTRYAASVARRLQRRFGDPMFSSEAPGHTPAAQSHAAVHTSQRVRER